MKIKKLIAIAVFIVLAAGIFSGFAFADERPENGWYIASKRWANLFNGEWYNYTYYYRDGEKVEGWQQIDGKWYYFWENAETGNMDRCEPKGEYYLGADGVMVTNSWREVYKMVFHPGVFEPGEHHTWESYEPRHWEYYGANGKRTYGWAWIGGKLYHFDDEGLLQTGWFEDESGEYYLTEYGAKTSQWLKDSETGTWSYFKADGALAKDEWVQVKNKWYLFDEDGVMLTGLRTRYNNTYYLDDSGAMVTGWKKLDGAWYYFRPAKNANGPQGSMVKEGWVSSGGTWYYQGADGRMVSDSAQTIYSSNYGKRYEYYMDESGHMLTGWHYIDGEWRFYRLQASGNGPEGSRTYECWIGLWNIWYYTDEDGLMTFGWKEIDGKTYYFSYDNDHYGQMVTGTQIIDGKTYIFSDSGALVK